MIFSPTRKSGWSKCDGSTASGRLSASFRKSSLVIAQSANPHSALRNYFLFTGGYFAASFVTVLVPRNVHSAPRAFSILTLLNIDSPCPTVHSQ